jgi:hypothetical protein
VARSTVVPARRVAADRVVSRTAAQVPNDSVCSAFPFEPDSQGIGHDRSLPPSTTPRGFQRSVDPRFSRSFSRGLSPTGIMVTRRGTVSYPSCAELASVYGVVTTSPVPVPGIMPPTLNSV